VAETDNWGLAREIMHYQQIDDNITHLAVKVKEYQRDLEAARANLTSCESHLMFAHATEHVEMLHNVLRKMTEVRSG
jgi:predicted  nucleic acid-binding Zn-ribbon protein